MSTLPLRSLQTSILISRAAISSSLSNDIKMSQHNQFSRRKTPEGRKEVITITTAYYLRWGTIYGWSHDPVWPVRYKGKPACWGLRESFFFFLSDQRHRGEPRSPFSFLACSAVAVLAHAVALVAAILQFWGLKPWEKSHHDAVEGALVFDVTTSWNPQTNEPPLDRLLNKQRPYVLTISSPFFSFLQPNASKWI